MPSAEQILNGLRDIASSWKAIAIAWHVYFGALVLDLASGIRPSRRAVGVLLALPLLSVATFAWLIPDPANGVIFTGVGIALPLVAPRLSRDRIRIAPRWSLIPGMLLLAAGWFYPTSWTLARTGHICTWLPRGLSPARR
jgi:hypothetical protein